MRPRFPGMDPWLELPALWLDVHNRLITAIADDLTSRVAPKYFIGVEQHTYLSLLSARSFLSRPDLAISRTKSREPVRARSRPTRTTDAGVGLMKLDVEEPIRDRVEEWYLEIRTVGTGKLVTVIEILSPTNKSAGSGRRQYLRKRNKVLESKTSLIEIDLLRGGRPMPVHSTEMVESDYRILVSRGRTRPRAELDAFGRAPADPADLDPAPAQGPRAAARPQRRAARLVRAGKVRPGVGLLQAPSAGARRGGHRLGAGNRRWAGAELEAARRVAPRDGHS